MYDCSISTEASNVYMVDETSKPFDSTAGLAPNFNFEVAGELNAAKSNECDNSIHCENTTGIEKVRCVC